MANDRRTLRALAALLPAGALGLSMSLAAADAGAAKATEVDRPATTSVAQRLQSIRNSVSVVVKEAAKDSDDPTVDRDIQLAWWGNGGWRNGGWRKARRQGHRTAGGLATRQRRRLEPWRLAAAGATGWH